MPLHRKLSWACAAILIGAPLGALAQAAVIGEARVKTDVGEFVTSGGRTWACLGAVWRDEGRVSGGTGTRYSCAGSILDSETYTAVSAGRTAVALADMKAELDGVAANVARNADAAAALRLWIEAQVHESSKLLYETIAARFDAIPTRVLANKAFKDAIAKLREDILASVKASAPQPPSGG
jgi:hypothetical protein